MSSRRQWRSHNSLDMHNDKNHFPLMRWWVGLGVLAGMFLYASLAKPGWADSTLNPHYLFNSEPTIHVIHGQLWMFTTHDQVSEEFVPPGSNFLTMYDYHAMSTTNFHVWVDTGSRSAVQTVGCGTRE